MADNTKYAVIKLLLIYCIFIQAKAENIVDKDSCLGSPGQCQSSNKTCLGHKNESVFEFILRHRHLGETSSTGDLNLRFPKNVIHVSQGEICLYDTVEITWNITTDVIQFENDVELAIGWGFGIYREGSGNDEYLRHWHINSNNNINTRTLNNDFWREFKEEYAAAKAWAETYPVAAIKCPGNQDKIHIRQEDGIKEISTSNFLSEYYHCNESPQLIAMVATPGYSKGNTITVRFEKDTDEPSAPDVNSIIEFYGGSIGSEYYGKWESKDTYVITIVNETNHSDYHNISHPISARIVSRPPSKNEIIHRKKEWYYEYLKNLNKFKSMEPMVAIQGSQKVRLGVEGTFEIRAFLADPPRTTRNSKKNSHVAVSTPFTVRSNCDEDIKRKSEIFIDKHSLDQSQKFELPFWSLKGPIASNGYSRLKLPPFRNFNGKVEWVRADQVFLPGTEWSLHMWIYLERNIEINTKRQNNFRALFYHGKGKGHESGLRTPSVWLVPHSHKISLRISTTGSVDRSVESTEEIPTNEWVHLSFLFWNTSLGESNYEFKAKVVLNFDIELVTLSSDQFPGERVLANEGHLHIGQDAWESGPAMYLYDIALYNHCYDAKFSARASYPPTRLNLEKHNVLTSSDVTLVGDKKLNEQIYAEALEENVTEALVLERLNAAALDGHEDSLFALALINLLGLKGWQKFEVEVSSNGIGALNSRNFKNANAKTNKTLAFHLLTKAAERGHYQSLYLLGALTQFNVSSFNTKTTNYEEPYYYLRAGLRKSELAMNALAHTHYQKYLFNRASTRSKSASEECEAAAFYLSYLVSLASEQYHTPGHEPILEDQRLSLYVSEAGERGNDDEMIQFQEMQARKGNPEAMFAMGNLYYWGARGIERNQEIAFDYFQKAAAKGHVGAMTGCGNMLLKGEGVNEKNTTKAIEYYEKAIDGDDIAAMNGLGYIHYFGHGEEISPNVSKALSFFEMNGRDGDSLFNAAHIYLYGYTYTLQKDGENVTLEKKPNVAKAVALLEKAVAHFGHFEARKTLGEFYLYGPPVTEMVDSHSETPIERSCALAISYLHPAVQHGNWGRILRTGFDFYLEGDLERSMMFYVLAASLGYERGAANAAWLAHTKLANLELAEHLYSTLEAIDVFLPEANLVLGDICYYKKDNILCATQHWLKASSQGEWSIDPLSRAQASYNVAWAYEQGILVANAQEREGMSAENQRLQYIRAEKYLDRAESQLGIASADKQALENVNYADVVESAKVAITMARFRLRLRQSYPALVSYFPSTLLGDDRYIRDFQWPSLQDYEVSYSDSSTPVGISLLILLALFVLMYLSKRIIYRN